MGHNEWQANRSKTSQPKGIRVILRVRILEAFVMVTLAVVSAPNFCLRSCMSRVHSVATMYLRFTDACSPMKGGFIRVASMLFPVKRFYVLLNNALFLVARRLLSRLTSGCREKKVKIVTPLPTRIVFCVSNISGEMRDRCDF